MVKKQQSKILSNNGGNVSITELHDDVFIKYIPRNKYDIRTSIFQDQLYNNLNNLNNFQINKILVFNNQNNTGDFIKCHYEVINEKEWELNETAVTIIAENMAKIHNYSYYERDKIDLPIKNSLYDSLEEWEKLFKIKKVNKDDFFLRQNIFQNIKSINKNQIKIPLHRDFRKHNILFDGEKYILIDFDFAAYDFITLEIMGFISDLLDESNFEKRINLIEIFLKTYIKFSTIQGIIYQDLVTDYLNYLCVNTFPVYLKNSISEKNYDNLMNQRNHTLLKVYNFKADLDKIINKLMV